VGYSDAVDSDAVGRTLNTTILGSNSPLLNDHNGIVKVVLIGTEKSENLNESLTTIFPDRSHKVKVALLQNSHRISLGLFMNQFYT
jgi:hypothetical protein